MTLQHSAEVRQRSSFDIPYVVPANDNLPAYFTLSARCRALLHRLIAMHSIGTSDQAK